MKFGLMFANSGPFSRPDAFAHLARNAEQFGFDSQMRLSNRLVEQAKLEPVMREYAAKMASNAPLTMAAAKFTIREGLKDGAERDTAKIAAMVRRCFESEDYREGVRAFLEKRAARFRGR